MKYFRGIIFSCMLIMSGFQANSQEESTSKTLYHVLLIQWSEGYDSNIKAEIIELFKGLPSKVEGFDNIDILDLVISTEKFDTIIIQEYRSEEALQQYQEHPDHLRIAKIAPKVLSSMSKFDYWK